MVTRQRLTIVTTMTVASTHEIDDVYRRPKPDVTVVVIVRWIPELHRREVRV
jgi:hypothetical protein